MARFAFKLEAVLRHRERIEQDRQRELALAQGQMAELQGQLRAFNDEVQRNAADVRSSLAGTLNMSYLAAHRRYMLGMQRKIHDLAQRMAAQQGRVNEARLALVEATKQRKILDILRERQHEQWMADQNRREAAELDELSTQMSYQTLMEEAEGRR